MAKFTKGQPKPANSGRKAGTPNKVTAETRALIHELVLHGAKKGIKLFDRTAKLSPTRALRVLAALAEYDVPKLARTEVSGPDGGPLVVTRTRYADPKGHTPTPSTDGESHEE